MGKETQNLKEAHIESSDVKILNKIKVKKTVSESSNKLNPTTRLALDKFTWEAEQGRSVTLNLGLCDLKYNDLKLVISEIKNIRNNQGIANLKSLNLGSNPNLKFLPPELGELTELKTLMVNNTGLQAVPAEIGNLAKLDTLWLQDNKLTSLPNTIGSLSSLGTLYLENNKLTSLPSEVGNLNNLLTINLQNNQLTALPNTIGNLKKLSSLDVRKNKLTSLPNEIGDIENLRTLHLESNLLTSLPTSIGNLGQLKNLYIDTAEIGSFIVPLKTIVADGNSNFIKSSEYDHQEGGKIKIYPKQTPEL